MAGAPPRWLSSRGATALDAAAPTVRTSLSCPRGSTAWSATQRRIAAPFSWDPEGRALFGLGSRFLGGRLPSRLGHHAFSYGVQLCT